MWSRVPPLAAALGLMAVLGGCDDQSEYFGKVLPPEGQVFRFNNGSEPEYMDPQKMTGQPDGRMAWALFEGLTRYNPKDLTPMPGVAERWDISADGRQYTFYLRKNVRWSNGDRFTAQDCVYSWRRFLDPQTAAQYAYLIFGVHNAQAFNSGQLLGSLTPEAVPAADPQSVYVSWELDEEESRTGRLMSRFELQVPEAPEPLSGTIYVAADGTVTGELNGELMRDGVPVEASLTAGGSLVRDDAAGRLSGSVEMKGEGFTLNARLDTRRVTAEDVGIRALDDTTFQVTLNDPIPYFLSLCAFYPLSPVHRATIERWGDDWTRPEHMVSNGAFRLQEHRPQDRIVMVRNEQYWNASQVRLEKVIAYPTELYTTGCDLYKAGEIDLEPSSYIPIAFIPTLSKKKDWHICPYLAVYFYRVNVTHPVLKDRRVRKSLALAVDREKLVRFLKAGQMPASHFVPPGIAGYQSPKVLRYDPEEARRLLAEAGYPEGKGFPHVDILYNTTEQHRQVAEIVQQMWKRDLSLDVGLNNQEWKVYLKSQRNVLYDLSRSGWIADYADPTTFLDMWVTGGGNNNTGWSNATYDRLIAAAAREQDPTKRMAIFHEAETLLLDELPVIPLYIYTTFYLKKPYVKGYYPNSQDVHPLEAVWIDHDWQEHPDSDEAELSASAAPAQE
jgi:oligopeptide transport system substrate-binding protein